MGKSLLSATLCIAIALAPGAGVRAQDAGAPAATTAADVDAAFKSVQQDVDTTADDFSKAAAADTSLNDVAAAFIRDSKLIAAGTTAAQDIIDNNHAITPLEVQQLSGQLHAISAYAAQLAAAQPATDDCETMARANDKLINLLNFNAAANRTQDQVLDDVKNIVAQANGSATAGAVASGDIRALSQAHIAEADINGFLIQSTMDAEKAEFLKKCTSLVGPVTATMIAHFFTKAGAEWWTFSFRIHGFVRLHAARVATFSATTPVPVEGEIFGYGDAFTYKSDPYSTAYQKIVQDAKIHDVAPVGDSSGASYGGAQVSPVGFISEVVGTITGDQLDLKLGDAVKDFDPGYTRGVTTADVFSVYTDYAKIKNSYTLPYKNARWVLDHFFVHGLTLQIQHQKSPQLDYVGTSALKTLPGNQNSADYTFSLRACNPTCATQ